jgi:putative hydrolase of the HAD superfamily
MPSLGPLHTLVLDLDDTLYPERDYVMSGFDAVGAWMEARHAVTGFANLAREHFDAGHRGRTFDAVLTRLRIEPEPELLAQMVAVYRQHSPSLRLPTASADFLDWARTRFRLALISDGYHAVQQGKFRSLALGQWIEVAVFPDSKGRQFWKPHTWAYEEVMRQLPGVPSGFAYIGDNPAKDFVGARTSGWKTARVRTPLREHSRVDVGPESAADIEVADLPDLRSALVAAGGSLTRHSPCTLDGSEAVPELPSA